MMILFPLNNIAWQKEYQDPLLAMDRTLPSLALDFFSIFLCAVLVPFVNRFGCLELPTKSTPIKCTMRFISHETSEVKLSLECNPSAQGLSNTPRGFTTRFLRFICLCLTINSITQYKIVYPFSFLSLKNRPHFLSWIQMKRLLC
jgi:hypothetical protein